MPLTLASFSTPLWPLIALLEDDLDLVYDPLHCVALVLRHMVFHALWLWMPKHSVVRLGKFRVLLLEHVAEWKAPTDEGPQKDDFSVSCFSVK